MTNISGNSPIPVIIGDSDGLIGLIYEKDESHKKAADLAARMAKLGAQIIFPATVLTETITTLHWKLSQPQIAVTVIDKIINNELLIEPVDKELLQNAVSFFKPGGTKKNTFFDCVVAATAKKHQAVAIFSFDDFYRKIGFTLIEDWFNETETLPTVA